MINLEAGLIRVDRHLNLHRLARPLLRSNLAWRASGFSYATAVIATTGSYGAPERYLASMEARMDRLASWLQPTDSVLEFGCGLGGNLIGVAHRIQSGFGVDINPWFVAHARRLARTRRIPNLQFSSYDGGRVPGPALVDVVLCVGVFERLSKPAVRDYLAQFRAKLRDGGRLIAYFLTTEAMAAGFGRILGADSYFPWSRSEIFEAFSGSGFEVSDCLPRFPSEGDTYVAAILPDNKAPSVSK